MYNYTITSRDAEKAFDNISERGDSITLIDILSKLESSDILLSINVNDPDDNLLCVLSRMSVIDSIKDAERKAWQRDSGKSVDISIYDIFDCEITSLSCWVTDDNEPCLGIEVMADL